MIGPVLVQALSRHVAPLADAVAAGLTARMEGFSAVGVPGGTVTFLFTDIEGSTRLWEAAPDAMRVSLARHDAIMRAAIDSHSGYVFSTGGDGFAAAFGRAGDAVAAAAEAQAALSAEPWPGQMELRVRMGVHTGEATERDGDYFGAAVNRAARLMSAGHGGQVLVSAATAAVVGATGLLDLGEHRLRDLAEPQRVFQQGPQGFPPLRGLDVAPSNLPLQATELVGRRLLVGETCDLLSTYRAVTLTGVGGVGKTRLALEVGAEVLPKFPDGVWLVDLAPVAHEEMVLSTVAEVLGISAQSGEPLITTLVSRLSAKRMLVILDNCEHVIGPVARAVERVAGSAPDVRVLATSREALGIAGERVQPVPPLAEDSDAVELFVRRAVHADPSFDGAACMGPVVEICRRLDGIPLAIELAAARSRHMTAEQIAQRLDQRFRLLTGGARTAIGRHRTLEATVGWSYDLLEPTDQLVFQRLAVMAAPFDLDAAEAVASGDAVDAWEVLDTLGRLVDKSMVTTVRAGGGLRYRLLETLRQFAGERLAVAPDQREVTDRYARYWCRRAEAVGHDANRSDADSVLDGVDSDIDHYRAAFAHLLTAGDGDSPARAFLALSAFWQIRHTREALAWCEQFLGHSLSPTCRVAVLGFASHAAATLSPARALDLAREAIAVAEDHGLKAPWDAHQARMIVANENGDVAAYADAWRDAAAAAEATGSHYVVLLTATQRGMFGTHLTADISEHYENLLAEIEPLDSPLLLSLAYVNYGSELCLSGLPDRGLLMLRAGVEQAARVGPIAYSGLAVVAASCHLLAGNREVAAPWLRNALVHARDMGQTHLVAEAGAVTALIAAERDDLERAAALCSAARRHLDRIGVAAQRLPDTCWRKAEEIIGSSSRDVSDARKRGLGATVEDLVNTALEVLEISSGADGAEAQAPVAL